MIKTSLNHLIWSYPICIVSVTIPPFCPVSQNYIHPQAVLAHSVGLPFLNTTLITLTNCIYTGSVNSKAIVP
jgi:hypothetical protein